MQMLEQLRDRKKCRGFSVFCLSPLTYPAEISWHGFLNGLLHPLRNQPRAYKWRSTRRPPLQWPTRVTRLSIPIFSSSSTEVDFEAGLYVYRNRSAFLLLVSPCPAKDRPDVSIEDPGPGMAYQTGDIVNPQWTSDHSLVSPSFNICQVSGNARRGYRGPSMRTSALAYLDTGHLAAMDTSRNHLRYRIGSSAIFPLRK